MYRCDTSNLYGHGLCYGTNSLPKLKQGLDLISSEMCCEGDANDLKLNKTSEIESNCTNHVMVNINTHHSTSLVGRNLRTTPGHFKVKTYFEFIKV